MAKENISLCHLLTYYLALFVYVVLRRYAVGQITTVIPGSLLTPSITVRMLRMYEISWKHTFPKGLLVISAEYMFLYPFTKLQRKDVNKNNLSLIIKLKLYIHIIDHNNIIIIL